MDQHHLRKDGDLPACIALSILTGMAFTLAGYSYGSGNHIEQLPLVYRAVNPTFLARDFFVNAASPFGPRFIFAHFIALLARLAPVPYVYLFLTLCANMLVSLITFLFARDLFKTSKAGVLASCIVMSVGGFDLGGAAILRLNTLTPGTLIVPFVLLSLWAAMRQRPLLSVVLAGTGSLIHPLLGLETGGIALLTVAISQVLHRDRSGSGGKVHAGSLLVALIVLVVSAAISWVPSLPMERMDSSEFITILAFFRHPHHYVPSTFALKGYLGALSFFVASGIAWQHWRKRSKPPSIRADSMLILTLIVLALCVGGYVFVEVVPSRLWTMAQTFRLLMLPKWIGQVLISGVIASCLTDRRDAPYAYVFLISLLSPISTGIPPLARSVKRWVRRFVPAVEAFSELGPILLLVALLWLCVRPSFQEALFLLAFCSLSLACFSWPRKYFMAAVAIGIGCLLLLTLFRERIRRSSGLDGVLPQVTLSELAGDDIELAAYVRQNTDPDSIFLTPPGFGQFRLTAERAIVVDFKAFPFQEPAMLEWRQRLFDCYGVPDKSGFQASLEMDERYRNIDDLVLRSLHSKYHFTYAILYQGSQSEFPVVYENQTYRLVMVSEGTPHR